MRPPKSRDTIIAEKNARSQARELPHAKSKTVDGLYAWFDKHYTRKKIKGYDAQKAHWESKSKTMWFSHRTFLLVDGTETPIYSDLRRGQSPAGASTLEDIEAANRKRAATRVDRNLTQSHLYESACIKAIGKLLDEGGFQDIKIIRMLDSCVVDVAVTFKGVIFPVQIKTATWVAGCRMNFSVKEADGTAGGKYEDHMLMCIGFEHFDGKVPTGFDKLFDPVIKEMYIMRSSDIKTLFVPIAFDPDSDTRGVSSKTYGAFRYIVGRNNPSVFENLFTKFVEDGTEIFNRRG